jgi:hypothetical protein
MGGDEGAATAPLKAGDMFKVRESCGFSRSNQGSPGPI